MKTLALTVCLCSAALAAIFAPVSTSNTTELRRIAILEAYVAQLEAAHSCYKQAIPVSAFGDPGGKRLLGATRKLGQKFLWVSVLEPQCMPQITRADLGWHRQVQTPAGSGRLVGLRSAGVSGD